MHSLAKGEMQQGDCNPESGVSRHTLSNNWSECARQHREILRIIYGEKKMGE